MNAPFPFELVEPKANPDVNLVVDVLAWRTSSDRDWNDADHWTRQLDECDFFTDLTPKMKRQILALVAQNPGTAFNDVFNHMAAIIEDIIEEGQE